MQTLFSVAEGLPDFLYSPFPNHASRAPKPVKQIWIARMLFFLSLLSCASLFGLDAQQTINRARAVSMARHTGPASRTSSLVVAHRRAREFAFAIME
jgi:hypothetical protein